MSSAPPPAAMPPLDPAEVEELEAWYRDGMFTDPEVDDGPPPPRWAVEASEAAWRDELAAAAAGRRTPAGVGDLVAPIDPATIGRGSGDRGEPAGRVLLDGVVALQRTINSLQAVQQRWLASFARPGVALPLASLVDATQSPTTDLCEDAIPADDGDEAGYAALLTHPVWGPALSESAARIAAAEVGCALRWAPITARVRLESALEMVDELPATLEAQQSGDIDGYRASIVAARTRVLPGDQRRAVEERVLPEAGRGSAAAFGRLVDREVIAADPEAAARRAEQAAEGRGVSVGRADDDMAILRAVLPAADAMVAHGVLDEIARRLAAAGLAAGRGSSQLRADALVDLFRTLSATGHAHIAPCRAWSGEASSGFEPCDCGDGARCDTGGAADSHDGSGDAHGRAEQSRRDAENPRAGGDSGRKDDAADPHDVSQDPANAPTGRGGERPGRGGRIAGVRRSVALNVYLDAATLAGLDDQPGEIGGYGAITAAVARALAASADTVRAIITRPPTDGRGRVCGTLVDAGRAVYRPPDATDDYVAARDRTCRFPGCRAPAGRCDRDHREPFDAGGSTCPCNIDLLCRAHHRLKTFTGWRARPGPDDQLIWTSPLGRTYPADSDHLLIRARPGPSPGAADPPPF